MLHFKTLFPLFFFTLITSDFSDQFSPAFSKLLLSSDDVSLLSFKSKADLDDKLLYELHEPFDYCQCNASSTHRAEWFASSFRALVFTTSLLPILSPPRPAPSSLPRNNSLSGLVHDLSRLFNLKALLLDHMSSLRANSGDSYSCSIPKMSATEAMGSPPGKNIEEIDEADHHHNRPNLVFWCGEAQLYTMEQLMRGSAKLLRRGSIGTTYKAVVVGRFTLTIKRLE